MSYIIQRYKCYYIILFLGESYEKNNYIDLLITSTKKTKCSVDIINNSHMNIVALYN